MASEVGKLEEKLALLQAEVEEKRRELHTLEEDEALLDATLAMRKGFLLPVLFRALPVKSAWSGVELDRSQRLAAAQGALNPNLNTCESTR